MSEHQMKSKRDREMAKRIKCRFLNLSESQTKSNRGGKRPGAGRPRDPDSIRSWVADDLETAQKHGKTPSLSHNKYRTELHKYNVKHAHPLLYVLGSWPDESQLVSKFEGPAKPLLSEHRVYRLAHLHPELQLMLLRGGLRPVVEKFVSVHANAGAETYAGKWVEEFKKLLKTSA